MIVLFGGFLMLINNFAAKNNKNIQRTELATVAEQINSEIDTANKVYNGYKRGFELPRQIYNQDYTARIADKREIIITAGAEEYFIFLPVDVTVNNNDDGILASNGEASSLIITKIDDKIDIKT